jgi:O-antigen/teichoic acid export membrane protein
MIGRFVKDASFLAFANIVAAIFSVISIVLIIKNIELGDYGQFVYLMTLSQIYGQLINSRSWEYIQVYKNIQNALIIDAFFVSAFIILALPSSWLAQYFIENEFQDLWIFYLLYAASFLYQFNSPIGIARNDGRIILLSLFALLPAFVRLILVLIHEGGFNVQNLLVIQVISDCSKMILACICVRPYWGSVFENFDLQEVKRGIRSCVYMNLTPIVDLPVKEFDKIIVSNLLGNEVLGAYALVRRISNLMSLVYSPIYQLYFKVLKGKRTFHDKLFTTNRLVFFLVLASIFSILILALGFDLYNEYVFSEKLSGYYFLLVSICAVVAISGSLSPYHALFTNEGYYKHTFKICLFANLIYLMLLAFVINIFSYEYIFIPILVQALLVVFIKFIVMMRGSL